MMPSRHMTGAARQPSLMRLNAMSGNSDWPIPYGWSEDKARQYAHPERADFGAYVRRIGFRLD